MPEIEVWPRLPLTIRDHLVERMRDRNISIANLNQLRTETKALVPERKWYKDFGSFKLCGEGKYPKTFLASGQTADGQEL